MLVSCKSYKIKNVYFKSETKTVNARIIRIDSTENYYVYFLKNDTMNSFFTKSIPCKQIFKSIIDTTKNYQLTIKTDANYTYLPIVKFIIMMVEIQLLIIEITD